MASLTYVCFVPAKGLIRDLSANLSKIAFPASIKMMVAIWPYTVSHKDSQQHLQ